MAQAPYIPTARKRKRVRRLAACGMGERDVAAAMGIDRMTLRKYHTPELDDGRAIVLADLLDMIWKAADRGNLSAIRHLELRVHGDTPLPPYQSKKAEQAKAAEQVFAGNSEWGDDLAPIAVTPQPN
jgi:hypothetical protein